IQRALVVGEGGFARYREPENARARTQDLPPAYHDAGMFYFARVGAFEKYGTLVCPKTLLFEMDEGRVQDIDTPQDWKLAEIKYGILRDV
ncbi:MAG: pseudaminic acid cytidylyltransferase, partial [Opitutales bacterium]|nr:pseudaminic acid cytidylyltransferase [Opitutales bacterium]